MRRILTAATLAGTIALTGCAHEPPPVSQKVMDYYTNPPTAPEPVQADPLRDVEASVKMAGKDGQLVAMDAGQPVVNFGGAPGAVLDGAWQHNIGGFTAPAAYAQVELPADVTRIGAAARFPTGAGKSGSVALVIPSTSWESGKDWKSGVHFVVNGNGEWNVSYYGGGKVGPTYAAGTTTSFRDGREVRFDVVVDRVAGTAMVVLPDGSRYTAENALITADSSNFAIFELYETNGESTPAVITEMWASSK